MAVWIQSVWIQWNVRTCECILVNTVILYVNCELSEQKRKEPARYFGNGTVWVFCLQTHNVIFKDSLKVYNSYLTDKCNYYWMNCVDQGIWFLTKVNLEHKLMHSHWLNRMCQWTLWERDSFPLHIVTNTTCLRLIRYSVSLQIVCKYFKELYNCVHTKTERKGEKRNKPNLKRKL